MSSLADRFRWMNALRFSGPEMLFSAKAYGGAMLALFVASWSGLPRPFWAFLTAYVVAQPLAGSVRSKAVYRFFGTLAGSTAAVLIVPGLSNAPELASLMLALWVGLCLFVSLHDRTPRSYAFMLAGYTAALIGFPSAGTPAMMFDNGVARVEEIGIGILSASIVHSVFWPTSLGPRIVAMVDGTLRDARRWFDELLGGPPDEPARRQAVLADRQKLAIDVTALRLLSVHLPFDTSHLRWTTAAVRGVQDGVAALTPTLSALEDRLQALVDAEGDLAPDVRAVLQHTADWLRTEGIDAQADPQRAAARLGIETRLRAFAGQSMPATDASAPDWHRALRIALAVRLFDLIRGWADCMALRRSIDDGLHGHVPRDQPEVVTHQVLYKDRGLALLSAAAAVVAILLCCAFWIATGWPSGSAAPMMAAVFCSFFAAMDDPVPAIRGFLKFTLWSMPLGALYVLVVIPAVHNFETLVLLCAPTFLFLGCFVARPATMGAGMATLFGVAGALTLHDTGQSDFAGYLNAMLAQIVGIVTAVVVTATFRSVGAEWSVRRLRLATWRELADMAAGAPEAVQPRAWRGPCVPSTASHCWRHASRSATPSAASRRQSARCVTCGSAATSRCCSRCGRPCPRPASPRCCKASRRTIASDCVARSPAMTGTPGTLGPPRCARDSTPYWRLH